MPSVEAPLSLIPFIEPAVVIALTFNDPLQAVALTNDIILAAEYQYILPILGQEFFDIVKSETELYAVLIQHYITPCLVYYTKALAISLNDKERNVNTGSDQLRADYVSAAMCIANIRRKALITHLAAANYGHAPTTKKRISGILF